MTQETPSARLPRMGQLAREGGKRLPLQVLQSAAGYYIGTADEEGPYSRESLEYYRSSEEATTALEKNTFTQREHP